MTTPNQLLLDRCPTCPTQPSYRVQLTVEISAEDAQTLATQAKSDGETITSAAAALLANQLRRMRKYRVLTAVGFGCSIGLAAGVWIAVLVAYLHSQVG